MEGDEAAFNRTMSALWEEIKANKNKGDDKSTKEKDRRKPDEFFVEKILKILMNEYGGVTIGSLRIPPQRPDELIARGIYAEKPPLKMEATFNYYGSPRRFTPPGMELLYYPDDEININLTEHKADGVLTVEIPKRIVDEFLEKQSKQ